MNQFDFQMTLLLVETCQSSCIKESTLSLVTVPSVFQNRYSSANSLYTRYKRPFQFMSSMSLLLMGSMLKGEILPDSSPLCKSTGSLPSSCKVTSNFPVPLVMSKFTESCLFGIYFDFRVDFPNFLFEKGKISFVPSSHAILNMDAPSETEKTFEVPYH